MERPASPASRKAAGEHRSQIEAALKAPTPATWLSEAMVLSLQRLAGNAAVAELLTANASAMSSVLLEKVASGGQRPLNVAALVPGAAGATTAGPVSVLLHLHGLSSYEGHRYEQMIAKGEIPPEYQMASQLQSYMTANPRSPIVAILPAGKTIALEGGSSTVDFGSFDTDKLADESIKRLIAAGRLPAGSTAGGVILSAHSAGGLAGKRAARGKKVVGMLAFESVHGDVDEYRKLLAGRLDEDLRQLKDIAARPGLPAEQLFQLQKQYLAEHGFRFVGFAGSNRGYRDRFRQLDRSVHGPGGWVEKHAEALQQASGAHYGEIRAMLEGNYQFHVAGSGDHFKVMQGNLGQALGGPAPAPMAAAAPVIRAEKPSSAPTPTAPRKSPAAVRPAKKKRRPAGPRALPEGAITSTSLGKFGNEQETAFRRAVYDEQMRQNLADPDKEFFHGLRDDQIGEVGGKPIHKDAEKDANALLKAARDALVAEKADETSARHKLAARCRGIGVNNAYRSLQEDFDAWKNAYPNALTRTEAERKQLPGGPFSDKAVGIVVRDLHKHKALPGFSNHTRGLAIDFQTVQGGEELGPTKAQAELWRRSWLHHWLVDNHGTYNFKPLSTEEWHWDHAAAATGPSGDHVVEGAAGSAPAPSPVRAPRADKPTPAAPVTAAAPHAAAAAVPSAVSITFGPNAKQDAVAASSIAILADILRAAGLSKATITSTARSAADQARAMYQNLVTAGVEAQRALYRGPGNQVIDTFVALSDAGKSPQEIQDGMRDRILEIGPSKVSRHCGDFHVLNVFDVGPYSLGGPKARQAFADAARADARVSKFIPWPQDPGDHFEIKMSSAPPAAAVQVAKPAAPVSLAKPAASAPVAKPAAGSGKWTGSAEQKDFLERVLQAHIASSTARAKQVLPDLSGDELGDVAGTDVQMKKEAAAAAGRLIAAANAALQAARAGDADAMLTTQIGATSGYRGRSKQEALWRGYFPGFYERTAKERAKKTGGEHGEAAVAWMRDYVRNWIAAPGFSNHQAGVAIDLKQFRTKGHDIHNSSKAADLEAWRASWLWNWLNDNAATFQFGPYKKEPWHWEYGSEGR